MTRRRGRGWPPCELRLCGSARRKRWTLTRKIRLIPSTFARTEARAYTARSKPSPGFLDSETGLLEARDPSLAVCPCSYFGRHHSRTRPPTMAVKDELSPIVVNAWLPHKPLPGEDEEAIDKKPIDQILRGIPYRLVNSAPKKKIVELKAALEAERAKIKEAGEGEELSEEQTATNAAAEEAIAPMEEELAAAEAAYEELTGILCKGQLSTLPWIDSLMRYVDLGGSCIVPGGAVAADDAFRSVNGNLTDVNGMLTEKQLAESKAWAEYITQAKLEKPGGYTIVCKYAPNPYLSAQAAIDAFPAWVERQITLGFGVELEEGADPILPHVMLAWPDPSVPGVAEVIAKMLGPLTEDAEEGKVKAVSLDLSGDVSCDPRPLRECLERGGTSKPSGVVVPGIHALDKVGAQLVADATRSDVKVIAGDALLGGLVSERYLRVPAPTLAELKGTAAFAGLARVLASPGGWDGFQATLEALEATGRGVATALVQAFADAGMKVEIETELEKGPAFEIGEPLGEEHTAAIVAAMSA